MDSHDRLPRSAAAPVRAALGPSPIAESRDPASATAPSPPVSTRQRLTPNSSSKSTRQQNISMFVPARTINQSASGRHPKRSWRHPGFVYHTGPSSGW